ncbi:MAG: hypothetical protein E7336_03040 [Clostridiales bacterium]|nr:hypothetical protein [Clostridiales bacterium]
MKNIPASGISPIASAQAPRKEGQAMMNDPSRIPAEQENKATENILKKIWKRLTHQWAWKITCLALAICLWGGLISQDATLPREKVFENVKINISGTTTMKNNGFIVVEGLDELEPIQIKVSVPQKYYNSVTASYYNTRLDLSQIKDVGQQTLKIITSSTASVYGTVTETSVTEIPVVVEHYVSRSRIPVEVRAIGEAPEGYMAIIAEYDPLRVDIAGPASVVEQVSVCVVEYDFSTLPAAYTQKKASCSFHFESADGKRLDSDDLTVTYQSTALQNINLALEVYPWIDVPVYTENLVSGEPAQGYEITGITVKPEYVTLAGADISRYLNGESIHPYSNVNVAGKKQNVISTLTLRVPTSLHYASDTMVTVIVTIEPIRSGFSPVDDAQ